MVSIQQARQQLSSAQASIQKQAKEVQKRIQQVRKTRLRELSPRQIRLQTRTGLGRRQLATKKLETSKTQELSRLEKLQKELSTSLKRVGSGFASLEQLEKQLKKSPTRTVAEVRAEKQRRLTPEKTKEEVVKIAQEATAIVPPPTDVSLKVRDPVIEFFKTEVPDLAKSIFQDFKRDILPTPEAEARFGNFTSKIQNKSDQVINKLDEFRVNIEDFIDPTQANLRNQAQRNFDLIENQQGNLNRQIESFNNQFGDRELSAGEFEKAQVQAENLAKKQSILNAKVQDIDQRFEDIQARRGKEFEPFIFTQNVLKGIATAPVTLAQFALGAVTRPIKTTKETITGFREAPGQIVRAPVTAGARIAGELIGTALTLKILRNVTSNSALKTSGRSFIVEKAKGIKKTPLSRTFPLEVRFAIDDLQIREFAKNRFASLGRNFDALDKISQNFVIGQIKAKIRNNPELFIPETRKIALRRAGVKNLRQTIIDRLDGKFDTPIDFKRLNPKKAQETLPEIQRLSLRRFQEGLETARIERAKVLGKEISKKPFGILTEAQKLKIIEQIERRIRFNPELTLTKTQRIALKNARTASELARVRQAILRGLEPPKVGDLLTLQQKSYIKSQLERILRFEPRRTIPKTRRKALENLQKQQEKIAIERAKAKNFQGVRFVDLFSPEDKARILAKFRNLARTQPERFVPGARGQALKLIQKQKQQQRLVQQRQKVFVLEGEQKLSSAQRLALKRLRSSQVSKPIIRTAQPTLLTQKQKIKQQQMVKASQKQVVREKQKLIQSQKQVSQSQKNLTKQIQQIRSKQATLPLFSQESQQLSKQTQKLRQQQLQLQKQGVLLKTQLEFFNSNLADIQRLNQLEKQREAQRQKLIERSVLRTRPRLLEEPKKKVKKRIKRPVKKGLFDVFVRRRGQDIKIKTTKSPTLARKTLKKRLGTTLRASGFVVDKKTGLKLKPRVTSGFRLSKTRKNVLVELRGKRLDTGSETQAIKRAKQTKLRSTSMFKKSKKVKKLKI